MNVWCVYLMDDKVNLNPGIATHIGRFILPAATLEDARAYVLSYGGATTLLAGEAYDTFNDWHLIAIQLDDGIFRTFAIREEPVYVAAGEKQKP